MNWLERAAAIAKERDEAQAEVERLRGLLRQLEWTATIPTYGDETEEGCPVCKQSSLDGHAPDCWLAAELAKPGSKMRPIDDTDPRQYKMTED